MKKLNNSPLSFYAILFLSSLVIFFQSCSKDNLKEVIESEIENTDSNPDISEEEEAMSDESAEDDNPNEIEQEELPCLLENQVISEKEGLVVFEFENDAFTSPWSLEDNSAIASGEGYMFWEGDQYLGSPGNGIVTYNLKINKPGTYQFIWHSAVVMGNSGTDHNDTWLRFPDAADFYGKKGTSIVYPKGSGKSPNPEGAGADGWFKVYRSGNNLDFKWQASTYDNNAHDIFVEFGAAGIYKMEISARSSGHAIDKAMLFETSINKNTAIENSAINSSIDCID